LTGIAEERAAGADAVERGGREESPTAWGIFRDRERRVDRLSPFEAEHGLLSQSAWVNTT
jgi:hypothetical protein